MLHFIARARFALVPLGPISLDVCVQAPVFPGMLDSLCPARGDSEGPSTIHLLRRCTASRNAPKAWLQQLTGGAVPVALRGTDADFLQLVFHTKHPLVNGCSTQISFVLHAVAQIRDVAENNCPACSRVAYHRGCLGVAREQLAATALATSSHAPARFSLRSWHASGMPPRLLVLCS